MKKFFLLRLSIALHYGVQSTTASASLSNMNVETLKRLGMSASEIETILGNTINQNDEPDFSIPSTALELEEDLYSYDEYETEEDEANENDLMQIDENQLQDVDKKEDNTEAGAERYENNVNEDWWKDPFASLEREQVQENQKDEKIDEESIQELDAFTDTSKQLPQENIAGADQDDNDFNLKLEEEILDDISDAFSEYSYDDELEDEEEKIEDDEPFEAVKEAVERANVIPESESADRAADLDTSVNVTPDLDTSTEIAPTDGKGTVSAVTLAALPKIGSALVGSPVAVQAFAAFALGNVAFSIVKKSKKKEKADDVVDSAINENQSVKDDDSIYEELDYDYNEDFAFGKPVPSRSKDDFEESSKQNESIDNRIVESSKDKKSKERKRWGKKKDDSESKPQKMVKPIIKRHGFGFRGKRHAGLETNKLLEEITDLKERAAEADQARHLLEKDVDRAMNQLKEAQKELREVSQTNNYLKNQLADNKRIMEKAVNAERQKLNNEMSKLREQMIQILERERRIMRAQLMKSSAEVRSLIENSIAEEDEYEYIEEEVDEE